MTQTTSIVLQKCFWTSKLDELYNNEQVAGACVLLLNNGTSICVSKLILAAASPVFLAMFCSSFAESTQDKINLEDDDSELVALVIRFLYSMRLTIAKSKMVALYALTEKVTCVYKNAVILV